MSGQTLPVQIAAQLRREILRGRLAPGASIKERDSAAILGVSRTPLREAIRMLATEGLVELRPARSPVVAEFSYKQIADNIAVLTALELLSGQLACEIATPAQIAEVAAAQDRLERLWDDLDPIDIFELDMDVHLAIARASNNPVLVETHKAILSRMWRARYLSARRKHSRARVLAEHKAIVEGLQTRDAAMVRSHLESHLEHLLINVQDYFAHGAEAPAPQPAD